MKNSMLYLIYQYNQEAFVSMFCENKSRPQLHCNGKCKLAAMLKEKEKEAAADVLKQLQTEIVYYSCGNVQLLKSPAYDVITIEHIVYYQYSYSYLYISKSYHPPQAFQTAIV